MNHSGPPPHKQASLLDYLVRYDLAAMLEETRLDYSHSTSGGPRHLAQQDIAARFPAPHPPIPKPDEPA